MSSTPHGLPLLAAAQAQKHVTHNEALLMLDALLCARFLDRDLTAPPAAPSDGDTYLVHATATGDWSGKDGQIAYAIDGAWRFYAPFTGLAAFVVDESRLVVFNGTAWVDYASLLNLSNVPLLGVNTAADATNKLATKSAALLFDNVGNGIQAKLNKHAAGDTASFLFQTNYSGRAEIGLAGDDDFHFKVSPDGATWYDGLDINRADGSIDFLASEAAIASAATTDLGTAPSLKVNVTGTTAITAFGAAPNALRFVRFSGALTLTHNATSLILLGGANRTTAAGDVGIYTSDPSGNWRERDYRRAAADPGDMATKSGTQTLTNKTLASPTLSGTTALPGSGQISSSGYVGIGGSPSYPFSATTNTAGTANLLFLQNTSSDATATARQSFYNDAGNYAFLQWASSAATSPNRFGFVSSAGDLLFSPGFAPAIYANASGNVAIGGSSVNAGARLDVAGHVYPHADNAYNLGSASFRFATVYAGTGTINTSGADAKRDVRAPSEDEMAVAAALASNVRIFRFCDAVAAKGDAARLHAGMIFEDVVAAFAAHGLDPMYYGIVCRDRAAQGDGSWIVGLRYQELTQFVLAGLAARIARLEAVSRP
ncbi:MAG TPA: DUF2793 domain-containing protein [Rhizomicrobium sp.]